MRRTCSRIRRWLTRFRRDQSGVSALEFALMTPLLLLLVFGLNEISRVLMVQRKVAHTASAVGDLVSQASTLTKSDISNVFDAGSAIIVPFSATPLKLRVTNITGDANGNPKVVWSRGSGLTALTAVPSDLPANLVTVAGETVILSEAQYTYDSPLNFTAGTFKSIKGMALNEKSYLRPRNLSVDCTDC